MLLLPFLVYSNLWSIKFLLLLHCEKSKIHLRWWKTFQGSANVHRIRSIFFIHLNSWQTSEIYRLAKPAFIPYTGIVCPPPHSDPANGNVSCSDGNNEGSVCTFTCIENYSLVGSPASTCLDDGNLDLTGVWSTDAPSCLRRFHVWSQVLHLFTIPFTSFIVFETSLRSGCLWAFSIRSTQRKRRLLKSKLCTKHVYILVRGRLCGSRKRHYHVCWRWKWRHCRHLDKSCSYLPAWVE